MYSFDETQEYYFKTKEEKRKYEKKDYSGIVVCITTFDTIG